MRLRDRERDFGRRREEATSRGGGCGEPALPIWFRDLGLFQRETTTRGKSFTTLRMQPARFRISCAAKPETVMTVCEIVKKQLALPDDSAVTGESKFAALGADSLNLVP